LFFALLVGAALAGPLLGPNGAFDDASSGGLAGVTGLPLRVDPESGELVLGGGTLPWGWTRAQGWQGTTGVERDLMGVVAVVDASGTRVRVLSDEDGLPTGLLWPEGSQSRFIWGEAGIEAIEGPGIAALRVDRTNGLRVVDGVGGERLVRAEALEGGGTRWLVRDGLGREVRSEKDAAGRWRSWTDPRGGLFRLEWLDNGLVVEQPSGGSWRVEFDPTQRPLRITSPAGRVWSYAYDPEGRLVSWTDPAGRPATWRWGLDGRLVEATFGPTRVRLAWNGDGRLQALEDPLGGLVRLAWDEQGRLVRVEDAAGVVYRVERDASGWISAIEGPNEATWSFGRDLLGNVDAVISPMGRQVRLTRGADRRVLEIHREGFAPVRLRRGVHGRVTRVEAPGDRKTGFLWDAGGRLRGVRRGDGSLVWLERDPAGELSALVGARGAFRIHRDALGRPIAAGDSRWRYDADGLLVESRNHGVALGIVRDPGGYIGAVRAPGVEVSVGRDAAGRPVRWSGQGAPLSLVRDPAGRVLQIAGPSGEVAYGRDARGFVTEVLAPQGTWRFAREAGGRVARASLVDGPSVGMDWSLDGDLMIGRLPGGAILSRAREGSSWHEKLVDAGGKLVLQRTVAEEIDGAVLWSQEGEGSRLVWRRDPNGELTAIEGAEDALWAWAPGVARGPQGLVLGLDDTRRIVELRPPEGVELWGLGAGPLALYREQSGRVNGVMGVDAQTNLEWDPFGRLRSVRGPAGEWLIERDSRGVPYRVRSREGLSQLVWAPVDSAPGGASLLASGAVTPRRSIPGWDGLAVALDEFGLRSVARLIGDGGEIWEDSGNWAARTPAWDLSPFRLASLANEAGSGAFRVFSGGPIVSGAGAFEPVLGQTLNPTHTLPWGQDLANPLDPTPWAPEGPWAEPLELLVALGALRTPVSELVGGVQPIVTFPDLPLGEGSGRAPLAPAPLALQLPMEPILQELVFSLIFGGEPVDLRRLALDQLSADLEPAVGIGSGTFGRGTVGAQAPSRRRPVRPIPSLGVPGLTVPGLWALEAEKGPIPRGWGD
jgi:YD repeat-containing protein